MENSILKNLIYQRWSSYIQNQIVENSTLKNLI